MANSESASRRGLANLQCMRELFPGVLISVTVAVAAQFIADRYGAPAMLIALLLGIALNFLAEEGRCVGGIDLAARSVLRIGVSLLGMRISVDLLVALGFQTILLLASAVVATILFALVAARLLGRGWGLGVLTGGAVAICGASAAMAIASVLPRRPDSDRHLAFTVLGVTVLSTVAMILYPLLIDVLDLDDHQIGIFLGGTIHDVAQVVGAGFSVSPEAGETATLVKLIRVSMLAPVVLLISLTMRRLNLDAEQGGAGRRALLPGFVIAFLGLATLNSTGVVPPIVSRAAVELSGWALLVGIGAIGMKTSPQKILGIGRDAVILIVAETIFIAGFVAVGITVLG